MEIDFRPETEPNHGHRHDQHDMDIDDGIELSPMMRAARDGDIKVMMELVARDPELLETASDPEGGKPLHYAAAYGHVAVLNTFLSPDNQEEDEDLLMIAVSSNQVEVVEWLLTHRHVNMHMEDLFGRTVLGTAVYEKHSEAIQLLLAHGFDVNTLDGDCHTPLHQVAMYDSCTAIMQVLLDHGADVDKRDANGNSPLHLAAAYGSIDSLTFLLQAGADPNATNDDGATPLHLAAPNGHTLVVHALLDAGADANARDAHGNTPLIDAAYVNQAAPPHFSCGDANTQEQVVRLLLSTQPTIDVNAVNAQGCSALFGAVRNGYEVVVCLLLRAGADATLKNHTKETVLHVAARAGMVNVRICELVLAQGADPTAVDIHGRTCRDIWAAQTPHHRLGQHNNFEGWNHDGGAIVMRD
ncbi:TPA: hypothetical protein N0F65_000750 [Lagenidium giganteum]|uniref:Ankyrin repeat protein n=1 Tax=Lagenidium giganteum TaxID=4803 RepID=A0AAV2ZEI3_9STRA|nr:TPA: hypothetical protein N0F65_000750 [Lagenidium giganteum]